MTLSDLLRGTAALTFAAGLGLGAASPAAAQVAPPAMQDPTGPTDSAGNPLQTMPDDDTILPADEAAAAEAEGRGEGRLILLPDGTRVWENQAGVQSPWPAGPTDGATGGASVSPTDDTLAPDGSDPAVDEGDGDSGEDEDSESDG